MDACDAVNESSFFVIQIKGLDVTSNNSSAASHWYIYVTIQICHLVYDANKFGSQFRVFVGTFFLVYPNTYEAR